MPPNAVQATIGRLRALSLALAEACASDRWEEVQELLYQRAQTINSLARHTIRATDQALLDSISAIDAQTIVRIESRKKEVCVKIRSLAVGKFARRAYALNARTAHGIALDHTG